MIKELLSKVAAKQDLSWNLKIFALPLPRRTIL